MRVLCLLLLVTSCTHVSDRRPPQLPDARMLGLTTLEGEPVAIDQLAHGRVAVVSLWATWCAACVDELPNLARLDERVRDRPAVVLAVAVGESRPTVARFVREHGLRYTQLVDEQFRFADALGQNRVPATLVIDAAGHIVYRGGALDAPALAALNDALAKAAHECAQCSLSSTRSSVTTH